MNGFKRSETIGKFVLNLSESEVNRRLRTPEKESQFELDLLNEAKQLFNDNRYNEVK